MYAISEIMNMSSGLNVSEMFLKYLAYNLKHLKLLYIKYYYYL